MGRSFNSVVQEMRVNDEKTYALLKDNLKKDLLAMMETNAKCVTSHCLCHAFPFDIRCPLYHFSSFLFSLLLFSYHNSISLLFASKLYLMMMSNIDML